MARNQRAHLASDTSKHLTLPKQLVSRAVGGKAVMTYATGKWRIVHKTRKVAACMGNFNSWNCEYDRTNGREQLSHSVLYQDSKAKG